MKNSTLTFWPKKFFEVNIHVEKPGKNLGKNDNVKFFTVAPYLKVIFEMTVTKRAGNDTFH